MTELSYVDQAMFLALRGAGQEAVVQGLWLYDGAVDRDGVQRYYELLGRGVVARLISRSPLPFARHRWVPAPGAQAPLDIAATPRSLDELYVWADEQVDLPLDPELGPGWRMGVLPLTNGGTAISVVASHCIADAGAGLGALFEAATGASRDLNLTPPGPRRQRVLADLRALGHEVPSIARAIGAAGRLATARRRQERRQQERRQQAPQDPHDPLDAHSTVRLPTTTFFIDASEWEAAAQRHSGTGLSLTVAVTGRLAEKFGRATNDTVHLLLPLSERRESAALDANLVTLARVSLPTNTLSGNLHEVRTVLRDGVAQARETPDEMTALLPLVPLIPRWAARSLADAAFGFADDLPVSCSNFGTVPDALLNVDGTPAARLLFRGVDRKVSLADLERRRGVLTVISMTLANTFVLTVIGYQPGIENSPTRLRAMVSDTLAEYGVVGDNV